jgi:hypothetical protein
LTIFYFYHHIFLRGEIGLIGQPGQKGEIGNTGQPGESGKPGNQANQIFYQYLKNLIFWIF